MKYLSPAFWWRRLRQTDSILLYRRAIDVIERANKAKFEYIQQLELKLDELNGQVSGMQEAAQGAAEDLASALPSLKDGDWGLRTLAAKVLNELADARGELAAIDEALAREPDENRAHRISQLSCKASVAVAVADLLDVPPGFGPQKILELCQRIVRANKYHEEFAKSLNDLLKWLGARPGERLKEAVRRVVLTAEVAPGAAKELQEVRRLLDIAPGETVLQALKRPIDYVAVVNLNKGVPCGITLGATSEWPPIGDVTLKSREL